MVICTVFVMTEWIILSLHQESWKRKQALKERKTIYVKEKTVNRYVMYWNNDHYIWVWKKR